ncbi:MAG: zf-HC2 domain-containing protein [Gemmatimonadota bacterium]|nr:zf-HC2 domain-containing protein [Gemmatimonadota bacterium]
MANAPEQQQHHKSVRSMTSVAVSCRDTIERLWEYLDGELEPGMTASIRHHVHRCRSCQAHHDAAVAFLAKVARVSVSDPATEALREQVDALLRERGLTS